MAQRDFNEIFLLTEDRVRRLAAAVMGGAGDEACDVVQDLYERLWRRRGAIEQHPNPEGYIVASARNLCLDRLRARSRRRIGEIPTTMAAEVAGEHDDDELTVIVGKLIGALPRTQATVMAMRDMECMEIDQIATATGMRPTAVRMALSRARTTVKTRLFKIMSHGL